MSGKPILVLASEDETILQSLIKQITKCMDIEDQAEKHLDHAPQIHPWTIHTKYYTAEINIIGITGEYEKTPAFEDDVEALVIYLDTSKKCGLNDLSKWHQLEEETQPEVKLLLVNSCTDETEITKTQITDWCLKRGYELVEINPLIDPSEIADQDVIEEKFGIDRVVEALQAHTWSNLVMSGKDEANDWSVNEDKFPESAELDDDELAASGCLDEFAEIFSQLSVLKSSIQSLPTNQKKLCAEQVVTAFWKAIGGDEEEIADLSSDDG